MDLFVLKGAVVNQKMEIVHKKMQKTAQKISKQKIFEKNKKLNSKRAQVAPKSDKRPDESISFDSDSPKEQHEPDEEEHGEKNTSEIFENWMVESPHPLIIEHSPIMVSNMRFGECFRVLMTFISEPTLYTISPAWGSQYTVENAFALEIQFHKPAPCVPSKVEYSPHRHNPYYFRSFETLRVLTNEQNARFLNRVVPNFIDLICKRDPC